MPFRYAEFTDNKEANRKLLADGVRGFGCISVSSASPDIKNKYAEFAPWGTHLSGVETYVNGAMNIFVRDGSEKVVGAIIVRPLTE